MKTNKKKLATDKKAVAGKKNKLTKIKKIAKASSNTTKSKTTVAGDEWPNKRNILFRPERYKYIKKIDLPKTCVFCDAAKNATSFETLCVYKSKHSMILLNKYPYNNGHLLVLPQRHIGELLSLSDEEYLDLMNVVKLGTKTITEIYQPAAMNLGMNHGAMAGAGIPDHLHFHIIPRWSGDLNFFPLIAETKVVIETLEQTYQHFMSYFNK